MSDKPSSLPYGIAALVVLGVVAIAWQSRDRIKPIEAGFPAPGFEVQNLAGEVVTLADYEDKVILLNIWATWCAPCITEMPSMQRLYDEMPRDQFEILAISIDAQRGQFSADGRPGADPAAFAEQLGLTFPILRSSDGDIQRTFRTTGVPESFLIARDGIIYKKVAGSTVWDADVNVQLIRRLVEGE